jgi:3-hydroxyacyl-CoA dehydrogenase
MENIVLSELPAARSGSEAVLLDMGDGVACLKFLSKGNSVTPAVREYLAETVQNGLYDFDGLVIANEGKHFSVGANLASMKENIEKKDFSSYREGGLEKAVTAMRYSRKPIVAAPYRTTLGGGLEVVLHTHARVAAQKSYMGLVEVGVGLIPGGGGSKESALIIGLAPAGEREEVLKRTFRKLITRSVSKSAQNAREMDYLTAGDEILEGEEGLAAAAKARCLKLIREGFKPWEPVTVQLPGRRGCAMLNRYAQELLEIGEITAYDVEIGAALAVVLCGSDSEDDVSRTEEQLLQLENECFVHLIQSEGTYRRISYFLEHNELLRN